MWNPPVSSASVEAKGLVEGRRSVFARCEEAIADVLAPLHMGDKISNSIDALSKAPGRENPACRTGSPAGWPHAHVQTACG